MSEPICAVKKCENEGTVKIGVDVNNVKTQTLICQKCWEDLMFNRVALEFKETEK